MSDLNPTAVSHEPTENLNIIGVLALGVMIAIGLVFFHSNRASLLTNLIHSWGSFGVILAVFTMVGVCTNSIPAEGLLIILLKYLVPFWVDFMVGVEPVSHP